MRYWGASPILPSTLSGLTPKTINYRKAAMGEKKVVISSRKGTNGVKNVVIVATTKSCCKTKSPKC